MTDIEQFNTVMNQALSAMAGSILLKNSELLVLTAHFSQLNASALIGEHEHANYEISFMEKGSMETSCDNIHIKNTVSSNNILFIPPGTLHHRKFGSGQENINFTIVFTVNEQRNDLLNHNLALSARKNSYEFHMTTQLLEIWKLIKIQGCSPTIFSPLLAANLISSFLILFFQQILNDSYFNDYSVENELKRSFESDRVKTIKSMLVKLLAHPSPLKELSNQFSMSSRHLNRFFYNETGMSLKAYQMELRLQHACNLLSGTDLPISEIAASLGFRRKGEFSLFFKTRTSQTPTEYRQKNKINPFL